MRITKLNLINFRNYDSAEFELAPDVNLIVGPNGVGKTNILEAMHLLSTTKSFRAKYDRDLIKYDKEFTRIVGEIKDDKNTDDLELQIIKSERSSNSSVKKAKINSAAKSLNKFVGNFNSVMFTPEDIEIITGSPSQRRRFLDLALMQTDAKYKLSVSNYTKVLRRRNKLLEKIREFGNGEDELPYWNNQLLNYGEYLQQRRIDFISFLNEFLSTLSLPSIDNHLGLGVEYNQNLLDTKRLHSYKDREIQSKTTLIGPHRDDLTFFQNDKNIAHFGSRGEQRTAIFSVRRGENEFIETETDSIPVLLLDDIFSELDEDHRKAIIELVKDRQTIITTAVNIEDKGFDISKIIHLS